MPTRPVVVLSHNIAISTLRRAMVAPCTTTIRGLLSEVVLDPQEDPIPQLCAVNLDTIETVSTATLTIKIGTLSLSRMQELCRALAVATACSDQAATP